MKNIFLIIALIAVGGVNITYAENTDGTKCPGVPYPCMDPNNPNKKWLDEKGATHPDSIPKCIEKNDIWKWTCQAQKKESDCRICCDKPKKPERDTNTNMSFRALKEKEMVAIINLICNKKFNSKMCSCITKGLEEGLGYNTTFNNCVPIKF